MPADGNVLDMEHTITVCFYGFGADEMTLIWRQFIQRFLPKCGIPEYWQVVHSACIVPSGMSAEKEVIIFAPEWALDPEVRLPWALEQAGAEKVRVAKFRFVDSIHPEKS